MTEHREVRTKTIEAQYSPVRLEQARLVSSLLYDTRLMLYVFSFKRTSGQLNSKDFRRVMTRAARKRTSYHDFAKRNYLTSSERFISVTYGFHFWIGSQSVGITFIIQFFQVQLDWSRQNLSLPIEHLFWISFRRSAKLSGFHLFCVNLLVHDLCFALQY